MDKNKIIEAAAKLVAKGAYDKAIKEYQRILDVEPKEVRILQKMGELYQKKNENVQAAQYFIKVAESYTSDGFFLKAVALFKQVLKLDPSLLDINLRLAELHQQLQLIGEAMAYYQIVANHHDKQGNTKASFDVLRKMVDLDPDNVPSRIKLADLYVRQSMNAEALAEFQKCAEHLKRQNRTDDYLRVAERISSLEPDNHALSRELAELYLQRGDQKRALAKLQVCFKADARDIDTLRLLAVAFQGLGQTSKTVSVYKELARAYEERGQQREADQLWNQIAELDPKDADVLARKQAAAPPPPVTKAPARAAPVSAPSALRSSPSALKAPASGVPVSSGSLLAEKPKPPGVHKLLTETDVYVKYGLHDKALEHLGKVFALEPENVDAHEKAYTIYVALNHAQVSEQLLNVLRLHTRTGDAKRAQPYLSALIQQNPRHPELATFLERLQLPGGPSLGKVGVDEPAEPPDDAILVDSSEDEEELSVVSAVEQLPQSLSEHEQEAPGLEDEALDAAQAAGSGEEVLIQSGTFDSESDFEPPLAPEPRTKHSDSRHGATMDDSGVPASELVTGEHDLGPIDVLPKASPKRGKLTVGEPAVGLPELGGPMAGGKPPLGEEDFEHERATREMPALTGGAQSFDEARRVPAPAEESFEGVAEVDQEPLAHGGDEGWGSAGADVGDVYASGEETTAGGSVEAVEAVDAEVLPPDAQGFDAGGDSRDDLTVPPTDESATFAGECEEAGFFIEQGLYAEAKEILETVLLAEADHPGATALLQQLDALQAQGAEPAPVSSPSRAEGGRDAFDLAQELADELGDFAEQQGEAPALTGGDDYQVSVEEVFAEFKKGLEKVVKPEDVDTHYDLGIAYKEMGLLDDAVGEFGIARQGCLGKRKEIDCLTMMAMLHMMKGESQAAVEAYRLALASEHAVGETEKALRYDFAGIWEASGNPGRALGQLMRVSASDAGYRDVPSQIDRLSAVATAEEDEVPVRAPPPRGSAVRGLGAAASRKVGYV